MSEETLDSLVDVLDHHHQRATYGAVAAVLDRPPRYLMAGRPRDTRHSWIVNRGTGMPTGYEAGAMHPELLANPRVLETGKELSEWLFQRRGGTGSASVEQPEGEPVAG